MPKQTLSVYTNEAAHVPNYEAHEADIRRFVGRRFDPGIGRNGGWHVKDEAEEVPYRAEYVQAVREGDLIPADEATARICGVTLPKTQSEVPAPSDV